MSDLEPANDLLGSKEKLDAFFAAEGYLYLQGVLDADEIAALNRQAVDELTAQGLLAPDGTWSTAPAETMDEAALHEALDYDDLWSSATTTKLFETIFGEPVFVFKQTQLRVMVPAAERYQTPPHQDAAYIGPTHEFRTCWVPLRDAPKDLGGVTLARRSHTKGVRPHELQDFYESFTQGLKTAGVHLEPEEDHWLSADYRLGDVVVFSPYMVHRSAPNRTSDGVRVSMDTRVQPARSERGYVSLHTAMEIRDEVRAKNDWYPETSVKD